MSFCDKVDTLVPYFESCFVVFQLSEGKVLWHLFEENPDLHLYDKVNRCLARYSPRATTASQPINRAPNEPAMVRIANFGPNLVVFEQKILFLLEKSKVLLPT